MTLYCHSAILMSISFDFELWRTLGYVTNLEGERIEIPQNESLVTTSSMLSRVRVPMA
jgi:hypothetical protein